MDKEVKREYDADRYQKKISDPEFVKAHEAYVSERHRKRDEERQKKNTDPKFVEAQRKAHADWYQKVKDDSEYIERNKRNGKEWAAANPDKCKKNRYKHLGIDLTPEEYNQKVVNQHNLCILCGKPPKGPGNGNNSSLHADHDHITGKVRDLLCARCNRALGLFDDDPTLLAKAVEYITRHRLLAVGA